MDGVNIQLLVIVPAPPRINNKYFKVRVLVLINGGVVASGEVCRCFKVRFEDGSNEQMIIVVPHQCLELCLAFRIGLFVFWGINATTDIIKQVGKWASAQTSFVKSPSKASNNGNDLF